MLKPPRPGPLHPAPRGSRHADASARTPAPGPLRGPALVGPGPADPCARDACGTAGDRFGRRRTVDGERRDAAALRAGDVGVVRGHDRSRERPACRQPGLGRDGQRADVHHQHRRLHVEHARRRAARDHRAPRGGPPPQRDAPLARDDGARHGERPVLQLVRPRHRYRPHGVAVDWRRGDADPLVR